MMIAFHARNIQKYHDKRLILDLDLHFSGDGLHVILGPNGCGKTSLLRLLALRDTPDNGEIILSENKSSLTHNQSSKQRIVLVPKPEGLFNHSVLKNIHYGLKLRSTPKQQRIQRVSKMLEAVDLSHLKNANALTLSSGEKQRLCMAMAMAVEPDVILLDEPTSSLDPRNVHQIEGIICKMKEEQRMIILVTHNISQARRLADTVTFMNSDNTVSQKPAKEFFETFDRAEVDGYL